VKCHQDNWLSNEAYLKAFNARAEAQRIPLSGGIDLTYQCNLKCVHCYAPDTDESKALKKNELTTGEWANIIDQAADAGCLYFLITGGEPLLRKDFSDIYAHAKKGGLIVTVFTNGTLIDESHVELFQEFPPYAVEISLYGATLETYEKITGVKGSYKQCLRGIQTLVDHHIPVKIKTILMTHNRHELDQIKHMAERYQTRLRFDAAIFPRFNGDKQPVTFRVSPREAVEIELADSIRRQLWRDYFDKVKGLKIPDHLYACGAGLTAFHVDPYGNLQPCLMVKQPAHNVVTEGFKKVWEQIIPQTRIKKLDRHSPCMDCEKRPLCDFCPAFFKLENNTEDVCSKYLCDIGHHRFDIIEGL
jgi:radical SAM protein with 4Fe4S-binding SPASM domain